MNFTPPPGPQMLPFNPQQGLAAFHPPAPMSMGGASGGMGMPGMAAPQQQPGFGAAQGAQMLSGALSGFKGWGNTPDGLPASGLGTMTGNAAQNAAGMNLMPGNPSFGDLGGTGFVPAFAFLGGGGP